MIKRHPVAVTIGVITLLALVGGAAALYAPAGMPIVVYWYEGAPIHVTPAPAAFFIPVALAAALAAVVALIYRVFTPMPELLLFTLALMVVYEMIVIAPVFGVVLPNWFSPTMALVGLFWIGIGNSMPKSRPMVRPPQTARDINYLVATRRFGSRFWIIAGVALVVAALLPVDPAVRHIVYKIVIWVAILPPVLYSLLWRERSAG